MLERDIYVSFFYIVSAPSKLFFAFKVLTALGISPVAANSH